MRNLSCYDPYIILHDRITFPEVELDTPIPRIAKRRLPLVMGIFQKRITVFCRPRQGKVR